MPSLISEILKGASKCSNNCNKEQINSYSMKFMTLVPPRAFPFGQLHTPPLNPKQAPCCLSAL